MRGRDFAAVDRARSLVLRHGWNATAYQILNPGIDLWFSAAGDAVVGYVTHAGVRVVAGAPVCDGSRLQAVAAEFEREAAACKKKVCYFCAEARLETLYRGVESHCMVSLGAQPVWDPLRLSAAVLSKASLRAQLHRAANKGVVVCERPREAASDTEDLQECLEQWLAAKGLPPLHFLIEPWTIGQLVDRRVFVAQAGSTLLGFAVASPVPARGGWLIEQIVRRPTAPNGTAELLLAAVARTLAADGSRYITLGLAPLSRRGDTADRETPPWLRLVFGWLRAHGRRFYNFRGLELFKAKFGPDRWDPVYAVVNEPSFTPRTLYAIAAAFGGGSPILLIVRAGAKAVRTEGMWLRTHVAGRLR